MTLRDASEAIERIADAGIKSPFTFWALLSLTAMALLIAGGSFWLLKIQLDASQERYNRLFSVMEEASQHTKEREESMIAELTETRKYYSESAKSMVTMLMDQAPTKTDEMVRAEALKRMDEDRVTLKKLEARQDKILLQLDQIGRYINGKSGR